MVFSSTTFLFLFLPVILTLYFALRSSEARNLLLLIGSLFFYAWGESSYVLVLVFSVVVNFVFGVWIERNQGRPSQGWITGAAVAANLLPLAFFKYAHFFVENLSASLVVLGLRPIELDPIHLPIGISFFTFQAISYVVDVKRRASPAQRNPLRLGLYIALFPQLIAGPIVRYRSVADQLGKRVVEPAEIVEGIRRFTIGLAKKVLIANSLARPADQIFALTSGELRPEVACLGIIAFALQLYFDFSGYTDMAIGLGRIFGFRFPENFNHPYVARSISEIWRRWHISLMTWLRDYIYVPLMGRSPTEGRHRSLFLFIFLLSGLWHGASWNFVIWGALNGILLILERTAWGGVLGRSWRPLQHLYTLLAWLLTLVLFRADTLAHAGGYFASLFGLAEVGPAAIPLVAFFDREIQLVLVVAMIGSTPWIPWLRARLEGDPRFESARLRAFTWAALVGVHALLLVGSAMSLAAGTHNPFIYFRF